MAVRIGYFALIKMAWKKLMYDNCSLYLVITKNVIVLKKVIETIEECSVDFQIDVYRASTKLFSLVWNVIPSIRA